ncbi:MAG: AMP-binding protein [Deltaproteobacteria bacterium]|nr:AMP-binding protein [Deltaproteobacteria bacterium]MBW2392738.1 AMP-binding protein [Deltaproteobacteria bacterium]
MSLRGTGRGGPLLRTLETLQVLGDSGFLSPRFLGTLLPAARKFGSTTAAGFAAAAARNPNLPAVIDDAGTMTFKELDEATNAIARGLRAAGVGPGDGVGLFARNHRGFVQAQIALDKLGANTLLLNTGFASPQLKEVCAREGTRVILYDEEFHAIVEGGASDHVGFLTWTDSDDVSKRTLEQLGSSHDSGPIDAPSQPGRTTILTSGTTGTPKGAQRTMKRQGVDSLVGLFGRMPLRTGTRNLIVAPTFHSWGGMHLLLASQLGCTAILQRRFDPEDTLAAIEEHQPQILAVVPVMMQRILALGDDVISRYDTSSLEAVCASGSALPGELALRWMNTFGDNVYNLYGSTEVAQASIAMPDELRSAPGTAGRPPRGVTVRIIDSEGREVPQGVTGRIFVGNDNQFDGYTGGGNKEIVDGLMSSGDVGHFDENGLLFVDGRDDDMIISGGENVFPREIEDLLADHEDVVEAAVLGVPDDEFGQRLKGFVVLREGAQTDEAGLKTYVKNHLARYKVPREIIFLDALPRNPTGKVLKRDLAQ